MKNKKNHSVVEQSISILLEGLTSDRKEKIKSLTRNLLDLSIKSETIDAVLSAVIIEALEAQMNQTVLFNTHERESSFKTTKHLFDKKEDVHKTNQKKSSN